MGRLTGELAIVTGAGTAPTDGAAERGLAAR